MQTRLAPPEIQENIQKILEKSPVSIHLLNYCLQ